MLRTLGVASLILTTLAIFLGACGVARAGVLHLRSCSAYGDNAAGAWSASTKGMKLSSANACGEGRALRLIASGGSVKGDYARWATKSPSQIFITNAAVASSAVLVNPKASSAGYGERYIWTGGSQKIADTGKSCCGGMNYGSGLNAHFSPPTHWFAFRIQCNSETCYGVSGQVLDVSGLQLTASDVTPPAITPDETTTNIANEAGHWIRGTWDTSFSADSQDGVCSAAVLVNGAVVARGASYTPQTGSWTQCGEGAGKLGGSGIDSVSHTIDTTAQPNGPLSVKYWAADAAQPANVAAPSYQVKVDNAPVTLSLSGPTQALTTSGPQYVTASAGAGPSGVSGIWCSVNGQAPTLHRAAIASVEVSTPGLNTVSCYARNNAIDSSGSAAQSPVQTWTIDIRQPSVSLISLLHVADGLRCKQKELRIHVPAHWATERIGGHSVRVRIPAQTRRVRIEHCHPRVRFVTVNQNGRTVRQRVVELPHRVSGSHARLRFGARPTASGWLGRPNGDALSGQPVELMAAPANGSGHFRLLRTVRTGANGTWTAHLRPGPSRWIEAIYSGNSQSAPAISNAARVTVSASPSLHVTPRHTHWGDTIRISGRLRGGYVPPSGELVVLKIGWRGGAAEIGHVYTNAAGRFWASYTFLRGTGSENYRIWGQTVRESDYPFSPARTKRIRIWVSS
jgi:hypothetical protein